MCKPYIDKTSNYITLINELIILVIFLTVFGINIINLPNQFENIIGWALIIFIIFSLLIAWYMIIPEVFIMLCKCRKNDADNSQNATEINNAKLETNCYTNKNKVIDAIVSDMKKFNMLSSHDKTQKKLK